MVYRNEVKHIITTADKAALMARLRVVAKPDPHAGPSGQYTIRSLYFDTPTDKALREKLSGVSHREKFRIRYYNGDISHIRLEKKEKLGGLGRKLTETLTAEEAQRIVDGDTLWMAASGRPLLIELYSKMKSQCLRPKVIVDYIRTPFVYAPGNVRITIDERIRTGLSSTDFLNPDCLTIPAPHSPIILEVKWDEFLSTPIRHAIQLGNRQATAFSKYAACRV